LLGSSVKYKRRRSQGVSRGLFDDDFLGGFSAKWTRDRRLAVDTRVKAVDLMLLGGLSEEAKERL